MKIISIRPIWGVILLLVVFFISACAGVTNMVWHQFSFNGKNDKWADTVDLLEYSYGDQYKQIQNSVYTPRNPIFKGLTTLPPQDSVNGPMRVGDFLYVKWRIKASGEILEQRVDLSNRLPFDMKDHGLTFVIDGKQLYVYVITPKAKKYRGEPPILKTWHSETYQSYEIFPQLIHP